MLLQVFSIFDGRTAVYARPFYAFNAPAAQRDVQSSMRDERSLLFQYADDYSLVHVGAFNDGTGELEALIPPRVVCSLSSLKERVSDAKS